MNGAPASLKPITPCWHCHWFGYQMAENSHGQCQLPTNVPMVATPSDGCAFWVREPGSDDGGPPAPLHPKDPARRALNEERARLVRITTLGERAALDGMRLHPECIDRSGVLGIRYHRLSASDLQRAEEVIERMGVNAAIRAGRL